MVRGILNDKLGFKTRVPDLAFDHDLKYAGRRGPDQVASGSARKQVLSST